MADTTIESFPVAKSLKGKKSWIPQKGMARVCQKSSQNIFTVKLERKIWHLKTNFQRRCHLPGASAPSCGLYCKSEAYLSSQLVLKESHPQHRLSVRPSESVCFCVKEPVFLINNEVILSSGEVCQEFMCCEFITQNRKKESFMFYLHICTSNNIQILFFISSVNM